MAEGNMKVEKERVELAALLDGEIRDPRQAARLAGLMAQVPALQAEFEEQRQIKSLLAALPEHPAPDFMSTRVLGEIAARRKQPLAWLKPVAFSATALIALVVVMTVATQQLVGPVQPEALSASQPELEYTLAADPGSYKPQDWRSVPAPEGVTDERLLDFLEFASEAHAYKRLMRNSDTMSPDIAEAILVLDQGGN